MFCSGYVYLINSFLAAVLLLQGWNTNYLVQAQNVTNSSTQPETQPTTLPPRTIAVTNSSTQPGDLETQPTTSSTLPPGAIAGIAVGCTAVGLLLLCFCLCVCCCCLRKIRRTKSFKPMRSNMGSIEPLSDTLKVSPSHLNGVRAGSVVKNDEFEMQVNAADSSWKEEPINQNIQPSALFAGTKSKSLQDIHAVKTTDSPRQMDATNAITLTPKDKGYVQMTSAGSVRPSRSLGNLAATVDETDIYTDPDTLTTGIALSITTNQRSSSTTKPPISPKPSSLRPSSSPSRGPEAKSDTSLTAAEDVPDGDLYVEQDIFLKDRKQQEATDLEEYYNSDTIDTIRKGRSLCEVVDPVQTHAVYANLDAPPTPGHAIKPASPNVEKEDYESIDDYFGKGTSSPAPQPPSSDTEYYNYRRTSDNVQDDYNYVEVPKPDPDVDPYTLEDNQYIYMKSNTGSLLLDSATPTHQQAKPDESEPKKRHLYQNLDYVEEGVKKHQYDSLDFEGDGEPELTQVTSPSKVPPHKDPKIMAELHFPSKSKPSDGEQELYVNVTHEDGGEELYEALT